MASSDNLFNSSKDTVIAINTAADTYLTIQGKTVLAGISADTVVKSTAGRVCTVSVIDGGATSGTIYDASAVGVTTYPIFTIPTTLPGIPNVYFVNMPTLYGIVVAPGTNQIISVSYS